MEMFKETKILETYLGGLVFLEILKNPGIYGSKIAKNLEKHREKIYPILSKLKSSKLVVTSKKLGREKGYKVNFRMLASVVDNRLSYDKKLSSNEKKELINILQELDYKRIYFEKRKTKLMKEWGIFLNTFILKQRKRMFLQAFFSILSRMSCSALKAKKQNVSAEKIKSAKVPDTPFTKHKDVQISKDLLVKFCLLSNGTLNKLKSLEKSQSLGIPKFVRIISETISDVRIFKNR